MDSVELYIDLNRSYNDTKPKSVFYKASINVVVVRLHSLLIRHFVV